MVKMLFMLTFLLCADYDSPQGDEVHHSLTEKSPDINAPVQHRHMQAGPENLFAAIYSIGDADASDGGELLTATGGFLNTRDSVRITLLNDLLVAIRYGGEQVPVQFREEKKRILSIAGILFAMLALSIMGSIRAVTIRRRTYVEYNEAMDEIEYARQELKRRQLLHYEKELKMNGIIENRFTTMRRFASIYYQYEHNPRLLHKKYDEALKNTAKEEKLYEELYEVVNTRYGGALDILRDKHPNLTQKDIDACCLLCTGFSGPESCVLFGYSDPNTIYVRNHRVKEKLGLDPKTRIEDYIQGLRGGI